MNPFTNLTPLAQAFGWTVVHSLWQIAIIWLVFKALEWKLSRRHQAVYLLALMAMLASTGWAATTFMLEFSRATQAAQEDFPSQVFPGQTVFNLENTNEVIQSPSSLTFWNTALGWLENHSAQIGWAWLLCAVLLWLRLIGGWWLAQRLRRRDVSSAADNFQELCSEWAKRLNINTNIQLLESPHIAEPLTLGFWKPVVLFPAGMLLQLSPAQVEALLLHELAHIRRHDYLVNLVQLALEVCFFYHPLFWMLSREARSRREFCCDEVVMRHTPDPLLYAKTLTDLQLSFLQPSTQFVMNATGKSRFTERILHIAGISPKRSARPNFLIALLLPLAFGLSSWWPSVPETSKLDSMDLPTLPVLDTTPPRNVYSDPTLARPRENNAPTQQKTLEQLADNLGKRNESQRVSINIEPSKPENVAIEVVKMNVLYVGVDNPLRIAAAGVPANELVVELIGAGSISGSDGNYLVRVSQPGEIKVRVSRKVDGEIKFVVDQKYRVKRIPDPTPKLDGKYRSSSITPEAMQQSKGIVMLLENFDFDAVCEVVGFEATYLPMEEDPISIYNRGGEWNAGVLDWVKKAKEGDTYFFDNIMIKCPGDVNPRNVGGLAFKIKKGE